MKCDTPYNIKLTKEASAKLDMNTAPAKCGKCYNCKANRIQQWAFRIGKELEYSTSAYFVTLTYDTLHVPIIGGRFPMTLLKNSDQNEKLEDSKNRVDRSLQAFFKRLRYYEETESFTFDPRTKEKMDRKPLKYYACGEYGARKRPHYHFIIFNLVDTYSIHKAWSTAVDTGRRKNGEQIFDYIPFGIVDIDQDVNDRNIEYVLKYICKDGEKVGELRNDNRVPEFAIMSKGLGKNWITPQIERFYNKRLDIAYVVNDKGVKIPMPRYYVNKMMTEETREDRMVYIKRGIEEVEKLDRRDDLQKQSEAIARQKLMKNYKIRQ